MVFWWALTENCSASFIRSHLFFSDTHRVRHSSLRTFEQSIKEKTGLDSSPHCSEMHNIGLILSSAPGPVLAIGRAGECLGPRALRRASITVASLYPSPPVQSAEILASLFIGHGWIVTHLQLNQLMLQFQCGSRLLDVCVTNASFRCCELYSK